MKLFLLLLVLAFILHQSYSLGISRGEYNMMIVSQLKFKQCLNAKHIIGDLE